MHNSYLQNIYINNILFTNLEALWLLLKRSTYQHFEVKVTSCQTSSKFRKSWSA